MTAAFDHVILAVRDLDAAATLLMDRFGLASVAGVLGRLDRGVAGLRQTIRAGGYMVIDEGFFKGEKISRAGYGHILPHEETIARLTSQGDHLVEEILTETESRDINDLYLRTIKRNAGELVERKPDLRGPVEEYIRTQEDECDFLDKYFTGAIWVLQKPEE